MEFKEFKELNKFYYDKLFIKYDPKSIEYIAGNSYLDLQGYPNIVKKILCNLNEEDFNLLAKIRSGIPTMEGTISKKEEPEVLVEEHKEEETTPEYPLNKKLFIMERHNEYFSPTFVRKHFTYDPDEGIIYNKDTTLPYNVSAGSQNAYSRILFHRLNGKTSIYLHTWAIIALLEQDQCPRYCTFKDGNFKNIKRDNLEFSKALLKDMPKKSDKPKPAYKRKARIDTKHEEYFSPDIIKTSIGYDPSTGTFYNPNNKNTPLKIYTTRDNTRTPRLYCERYDGTKIFLQAWAVAALIEKGVCPRYCVFKDGNLSNLKRSNLHFSEELLKR